MSVCATACGHAGARQRTTSLVTSGRANSMRWRSLKKSSRSTWRGTRTRVSMSAPGWRHQPRAECVSADWMPPPGKHRARTLLVHAEAVRAECKDLAADLGRRLLRHFLGAAKTHMRGEAGPGSRGAGRERTPTFFRLTCRHHVLTMLSILDRTISLQTPHPVCVCQLPLCTCTHVWGWRGRTVARPPRPTRKSCARAGTRAGVHSARGRPPWAARPR